MIVWGVPKTIDHDQRKAEIAAAVWQLIANRGVSAVSLRSVAAEAGIVLGSLRHSFPTKADLLDYAMQLVHTRVEERISAHVGMRDPHQMALAMLLELLPLDRQRTIEARVNLALIADAPAHPRLGKLAEKAQTAIAELCLTVCQLFADTGCMHPSRDPRVEARRLHEVIDGSMLHLLVTPEVGEDAEAALADYLADLSAPRHGVA